MIADPLAPDPAYLLPEAPVRSLEEYRSRGGGAGLEAARRLGPDGVLDELLASGLRGRGGAGFPAGQKWVSVREGGGDPGERFVVANGAEGEPGTFKDRALIAANPYQVIEGVTIAAETIGAAHAFVAIKASFREQRAALDRAIVELRAAAMLGAVPITVIEGPDEYLFGEEKALLEVIEGEDPLPRLFPPYLHGLFATRPQVGWSADSAIDDSARSGSNPTLVNNVETLANVAPILAHGAGWYRSLGTAESPGHVICTVVGDVRRAGVAEVALGTPLDEVIVGIGGGTHPDRSFKAALSGVANPVVTAPNITTPVSYEGMEAIGSGLGACGFIVYDDTRDMAGVARTISRFLYVESCGQCPPCKTGTGEVTHLLDELLAGRGTDADIELVGARLATVTDSNRCFLGAQEQRVIGSLLRAYPEDFVAHLEGARPEAAPPTIPKLLDILPDGTAVYDDRQQRKQPDWTYADGS